MYQQFNIKLGPILPRFRDIVGFLLSVKRATPLVFHLNTNFGVVPLGIDSDVVAPRCENLKLIIYAINFELVQPAHGTSTLLTDGRTDEQTDDLR